MLRKTARGFTLVELLIVIALPAMSQANDRVWATNFYGQDFLGEYLKTMMVPGEQFVAFTHSQDVATCSYAQHRCGFVNNLSVFKHKEAVYDLRYIYVGVSSFENLMGNSSLWNYIKQNYEIDLVGLMNQNNQLVPVHFILKKGGKFNLADIQQKQVQLAKTYAVKNGEVRYYYISNK